jgi:hypothetical protein
VKRDDLLIRSIWGSLESSSYCYFLKNRACFRFSHYVFIVNLSHVRENGWFLSIEYGIGLGECSLIFGKQVFIYLTIRIYLIIIYVIIYLIMYFIIYVKFILIFGPKIHCTDR